MAWEQLQGLLRNSLKGFLALPEVGGDVPIIDAQTGKKQLTAKDLLDTAITPAGWQIPVGLVPNLSSLGYARFVEEQPTATEGGALNGGVWQSRLNTLKETNLAASIDGSGNISMPDGTYLVFGHAIGYAVGAHRVKLATTLAAFDGLEGDAAYSPAAYDDQSESHILGAITITAPATYVLGHYAEVTDAVHGRGRTGGGTVPGAPTFAQLLFIRIPA